MEQQQNKPNLNRITSLRMAPAPPPRDGRLSMKPPVNNNQQNTNQTDIDMSQFRSVSTTFQRRMDSPRVETVREPVPALERSISATGLPKMPPPRPPRASQTLSTESVLDTPAEKKSSFPRIPFLSKKSKVNVDPNQFVPVNSAQKRRLPGQESVNFGRGGSAIQFQTGNYSQSPNTPPNTPPAIPASPPPSLNSIPSSMTNSSETITEKPSVASPSIQKQVSIAEVAPPQGGPTRAYNKRSEFYDDQRLSRRLSKNLAAPAVSLYQKLEDRVSYETLKSSKIILEPMKPLPFSRPTWTSRVRIVEEWLPSDDEYEFCRLICKDCVKKGFNIEVPRKNVKEIEPLEIVDLDKDHLFFKELLESSPGKIIHFIAEDSKEKIIISMENIKSKKFQRVIARTSREDQRLIIPGSSVKAHVKSLVNQCPFLTNAKITQVKKEDIESVNEQLLKMEKQMVVTQYKFGIFYAKENQTTEDEFLNNVEHSEDFENFITLLGDKIELQGWKSYRGGLDVKTGTTGTHSIYRKHQGFEIMFHVATLIPHTPGDLQQVERKRHIGNDMIVIIFKEGNTRFDPNLIRSQFNHVFAVVEVEKVNGESCYHVEWCTKPGVAPFRPFEIYPSTYERSEEFRDRFLTKLLNAERITMTAKEFRVKMARTRGAILTEIVDNISKK